MPEESKVAPPEKAEGEEAPVVDEAASDDEAQPEAGPSTGGESAGKKKKKKSKGKKKATEDAEAAPSAEKVEDAKAKLAKELFNNNVALQEDLKGLSAQQIIDQLKRMKLEELLTGLSSSSQNKKDMASYKFWQTQPVLRFDEQDKPVEDGLIKVQKLEDVKTSPPDLLDGFEWVTMDLEDGQQMHEVYDLLSYHYVEDSDATFRFNYSASFLNWALKSPGWLKQWHVGVRVTSSRKLVAFISGIPATLRVRNNEIKCSEINFLCIHKKLRSKRLAPVLIKEITRRCNLEEVWNAIYTAGVVLPTPISTCRYYHRALDWLKLYEVKFSPLPANSTKQRQISKYALPQNTSTPGLREMEKKDVATVHNLLARYLAKFDICPKYTEEEVDHWLLHKESPHGERVVWTYVVENSEGKVTDFFSFYSLESSVINHPKHEKIRAAYLFYYASETALQEGEPDTVKAALKARLNELMHDALILAKKEKFDVFNALTLLDNTLFLNEQKFGAGDGQLHYYLFNWRTAPILGGIDKMNVLDEKAGSGVGVVML